MGIKEVLQHHSWGIENSKEHISKSKAICCLLVFYVFSLNKDYFHAAFQMDSQQLQAVILPSFVSVFSFCVPIKRFKLHNLYREGDVYVK